MQALAALRPSVRQSQTLMFRSGCADWPRAWLAWFQRLFRVSRWDALTRLISGRVEGASQPCTKARPFRSLLPALQRPQGKWKACSSRLREFFSPICRAVVQSCTLIGASALAASTTILAGDRKRLPPIRHFVDVKFKIRSQVFKIASSSLHPKLSLPALPLKIETRASPPQPHSENTSHKQLHHRRYQTFITPCCVLK